MRDCFVKRREPTQTLVTELEYILDQEKLHGPELAIFVRKCKAAHWLSEQDRREARSNAPNFDDYPTTPPAFDEPVPDFDEPVPDFEF